MTNASKNQISSSSFWKLIQQSIFIRIILLYLLLTEKKEIYSSYFIYCSGNWNQLTHVNLFEQILHLFAIWIFFHEYLQFTGQQGKGWNSFYNSLCNYYRLHRLLDLRRSITADSSSLHIVSRVRFNDSRFVFHDSGWSFHEPSLSRKHVFHESYRANKTRFLKPTRSTKLFDNVLIAKTFLSLVFSIIHFFIEQKFFKHFLQNQK